MYEASLNFFPSFLVWLMEPSLPPFVLFLIVFAWMFADLSAATLRDLVDLLKERFDKK